MREVCFLTASRGNAFMTELLQAVGAAVAEKGIDVSFAADRYPPLREGVAYVAIPHEFFELAPERGAPTPGHLRRTVGFCVELPGTPWFHVACRHARRLGGLVDIRQSGVYALRMAGLPAVHAPLGYSPAWDSWRRDQNAPRPLDVVYMAAAEERRDRVLAGYAATLADRSSRLLIPPERPKSEPTSSFVLDREKYALLASTKTLLNLHRSSAGALEWPRVLEAICNGCVVVTERSVDTAPLVPGEHLIAARADSLDLLAHRLLDDPARLGAMRLAAYDFVRDELPMSAAAGRLVDVAEAVVRRRLRPAASDDAVEESEDLTDPVVPDAMDPIRRALKRLLIETRETRRELAGLVGGDGADPGELRVEVLATTPAYAASKPRVTVGISLHNYEAEVGDALRSLAASDYEHYELLVLDDASTDGSVAVLRRFLDENPWMPAALLRHTRNAGLARTRNAITERARGDFVFVLDADNGVYRHGLGRLVDALDADPEAAFAYSIIAIYENARAAGLVSRHGWDTGLLAQENYIDAMALIRRDALVAIGGYCPDPRLMGLEDYDLWCQVAERGWRGVHVPEILAWYRRSTDSMLSITSLDASDVRALLSARAPTLFGAAV